jgi:hypothetical protein
MSYFKRQIRVDHMYAGKISAFDDNTVYDR